MGLMETAVHSAMEGAPEVSPPEGSEAAVSSMASSRDHSPTGVTRRRAHRTMLLTAYAAVNATIKIICAARSMLFVGSGKESYACLAPELLPFLLAPNL